MEEKKSFEALQYSYENAGQFRAIAAVLGYSEEYRNGDIIFSKGNETYTYPLNTPFKEVLCPSFTPIRIVPGIH